MPLSFYLVSTFLSAAATASPTVTVTIHSTCMALATSGKIIHRLKKADNVLNKLQQATFS